MSEPSQHSSHPSQRGPRRVIELVIGYRNRLSAISVGNDRYQPCCYHLEAASDGIRRRSCLGYARACKRSDAGWLIPYAMTTSAVRRGMLLAPSCIVRNAQTAFRSRKNMWMWRIECNICAALICMKNRKVGQLTGNMPKGFLVTADGEQKSK